MGKRSEDGHWHTTVGEVVGLFHEAIITVMPVFAKAQIHEDGDDWDDILCDMYRTMVFDSICNSLPDSENFRISYGKGFPKYDSYHSDYASVSYIAVDAPSLRKPKTQVIFIGLKSSDQPLDTVVYCEVDSSFTVIRTEQVRYEDVQFSFIHRGPDGVLKEHTELSVLL